jgi:hypothetical protein
VEFRAKNNIKDVTYDKGEVMPDHPWLSVPELPKNEAPQWSEGAMTRSSSVEISREQRNRHTEPDLDVNCKLLTPRQNLTQSQSERRYRRNLDVNFLQLEDAVNQCHDERPKSESGSSKRLRRVQILAMARLNILELLKEVISLKRKLRILREATVPETCRFTIQDEVVGV